MPEANCRAASKIADLLLWSWDSHLPGRLRCKTNGACLAKDAWASRTALSSRAGSEIPPVTMLPTRPVRVLPRLPTAPPGVLFFRAARCKSGNEPRPPRRFLILTTQSVSRLGRISRAASDGPAWQDEPRGPVAKEFRPCAAGCVMEWIPSSGDGFPAETGLFTIPGRRERIACR